MAKYKAEHLKELIRQVVREEMKTVVSETINEVLSERYLSKLAESAAGARPRGVARLPIQGDDEVEEETPSILANSILGVGQENPVFKKVSKGDHVRQHNEDKRNEVLSMFFEGTQPLSQREARHEEGIPVEAVPDADPNRWGELFKEAERLAEMKKPIAMQKDPKAEEERLKRLREQLDRRP